MQNITQQAKLLFCIIIFLLPNYLLKAEVKKGFISADTVTVLFIGNSLTGFNRMPETVEELGKAAGKAIYCEGKIVGGKSVVDICNYEDTRQKILERDWTYIVIQGDIHSTAFPETHHLIMPWIPYKPIKPMLQEMKEFIGDNNPNAQLIFFMPWAYEDGMTWIPDEDDTYETMQQKICENALTFADEVGIPVAPVGWAWNFVWYDSPDSHLFMSDFLHPNEKGSYLTACVFYCTIFLESCHANNFLSNLDQTEAEYYQDVASSIVMNDLVLWNLLISSSIHYIEEVPADFVLYQNYPNPFNPSTKIKFFIPKSAHVQITIYNVLGQLVTELLDKEMSAGYHTVDFDPETHLTETSSAGVLNSGIYFYSLSADDKVLMKKMILIK